MRGRKVIEIIRNGKKERRVMSMLGWISILEGI